VKAVMTWSVVVSWAGRSVSHPQTRRMSTEQEAAAADTGNCLLQTLLTSATLGNVASHLHLLSFTTFFAFTPPFLTSFFVTLIYSFLSVRSHSHL